MYECFYWMIRHANEHMTVHSEGFGSRSSDSVDVTMNVMVVTSPTLDLEVKACVIKHGDYFRNPVFINTNGAPLVLFRGSFDVYFGQRLLEELECAICTYIMRPPIRQCKVGHSICRDCYVKLTSKTCPTCKCALMATRNFAIERMVANCTFPCDYKTLGCTQWGTSDQMQAHVPLCTYQRIRCFCFLFCQFYNSMRYYTQHVSYKHKDLFQIRNNVYERLERFQRHITLSLLILYDHLFFIWRKDQLSVAIDVISYMPETDFFYECELVNIKSNNGERIKFNMRCNPKREIASNQFEEGDRACIIPTSDFDRFATKHKYCLRLNIYKK